MHIRRPFWAASPSGDGLPGSEPRVLPCGRTPLVLALHLTRSKALSIQDGKWAQLDLWAPFQCQQPEILIMKKEGKQVRQITHVSFS